MRRMIGASESASIYLWGICAASILANIFAIVLSKTGAFAGMAIASWVCYVIMQVAFILTILIYSSIRKIDLFYVARVKKAPNIKQIILMPFIAIATILVFLPLANLWQSFLSLIGYVGAVATPDLSNVGVYFLAIFVMAVIPACGEELLIRGTVLPGLTTRNIWFGILMSGLFFSLMHANPYQTVHQFGLGVALAIVALITGSIWNCIFFHFFNNFISLTITAFLPEVDQLYITLGYWNWLVGSVSVIVGLVLLVSLLFVLYKVSHKDDGVYANSVSGDGYTLYIDAKQYGLKKENIFKQWTKFFKSLFTKQGWKNISHSLESDNNMQYLGKSQNLAGVWIALAFVCVYWFINFLKGII